MRVPVEEVPPNLKVSDVIVMLCVEPLLLKMPMDAPMGNAMEAFAGDDDPAGGNRHMLAAVAGQGRACRMRSW